jgi:hypothetical protein
MIPSRPWISSSLSAFPMGEGLLVADAEPRDGHVVGVLVGGQHPKGNVLVAAPLDLSGGAHPRQ